MGVQERAVRGGTVHEIHILHLYVLYVLYIYIDKFGMSIQYVLHAHYFCGTEADSVCGAGGFLSMFVYFLLHQGFSKGLVLECPMLKLVG